MALPDGNQQPIPVPDISQVSQDEIDALLSGPPSTTFDPTKPIMALDAQGFPLVLGPAWPIFEQTRICPFGQLAMMADGRLLSAPIVLSATFSEPKFVVATASGVSRDDSPGLAAALANAPQFRPVLFNPLAR